MIDPGSLPDLGLLFLFLVLLFPAGVREVTSGDVVKRGRTRWLIPVGRSI